MVTETETRKKELQEQGKRLWKLDNAISIEFLNLHAYVNQVDASDNPYLIEAYINRAKETLLKIKDSIRRYDDGLPQEYE